MVNNVDYKQMLIVAGATAGVTFLSVLAANLGSFNLQPVYSALASALIAGLIDILQQYKGQSQPLRTSSCVDCEKQSKRLFLGQKR
jgi:hypothetical protein